MMKMRALRLKKLQDSLDSVKSFKLMPKMPVKDSIKMSFWQKFIKYRRFPFKFVTHLLLVVFVTVQVFLFAREREDYLFSAGGTIVNSFLPEGFEESKESLNGYATFSFYKMEDVVEHLETTVQNYYEFANHSMDYFVYNYADEQEQTHYNAADQYRYSKDLTTSLLMKMATGSASADSNDTYTIKPIRMLNTLYKTLDLDIQMDFSKPLNKETRQEQYYLTPNFPSPFSDASTSELRSYFHSLLEMRLDFAFRTIFIKREYPEVLLWTVSLTYDFKDRGGRVPLLAKFDVSLCLSNKQRVTFSNVALSAITWVCIVVIVLSATSMFLVLRAVLRAFRLVRKAKKDNDLKYYTTYGSFPEDKQPSASSEGNINLVGVNSSPESLYQTPVTPGDGSEISIPMSTVDVNPTLKQRLRFFNIWHLLTIVGNVIGVISSIVALSNISYQYADLKASNILLGLSAIFSWSNIVQYFAHNPAFYILITSLKNGLPNVIRFIIGALPIFIGYGMCGMLLFGSYSQYFQGLQNSMVTLFSAANGDALHDTFDTIYGQNALLAYFSRIYLVSFVCLFTYCVLNIFILIMEDAYFAVREGGITEALRNELKQNVETVVEHKFEEYEEALSNCSYSSSSDSDSSVVDHGELAYGSDDDFWPVSNSQERKSLKRKRKLMKLLHKLSSGQIDPGTNVQQKKAATELMQQMRRQYQPSPQELSTSYNGFAGEPVRKSSISNGSSKSSTRPIPTKLNISRVSFNADSAESPTVPSSLSKHSKSLTPTKSILKGKSNSSNKAGSGLSASFSSGLIRTPPSDDSGEDNKK